MQFVKESRIRATPVEVFAFHESPGALQKLTPPGEPVEIIESDNSIMPGSRVVLRMKIGPFPVRWVAVHEEYEPPNLFSDRQESGPFASWFHRHRFLDDGQGGTLMRDEVEYTPPGGLLGRVLGGSVLRKKLEEMFDYRHEMTRKLLEAGDGAADPG